MNRLYYFLLPAIAAFCLSSCGGKANKVDQPAKAVGQAPRQAVTDLEAAIDGEATASAKYAAYAMQAARERRPQIAALFRATSKAESIHLQNHLEALQTLDVTGYRPKVKTFEVKTTAANLKEAIDGEKYESKTMYPTFIKNAQDDFEDQAIKSYKWALGSEKNHARLYAEALVSIDRPAQLPKAYYVCPTCGNVYNNKINGDCELCGTPSDKFIKFAAQL